MPPCVANSITLQALQQWIYDAVFAPICVANSITLQSLQYTWHYQFLEEENVCHVVHQRKLTPMPNWRPLHTLQTKHNTTLISRTDFYAVVTCEIKLSQNNLTIISLFYFACNHIRNWNKFISVVEIISKLFQRHRTCRKIFMSL